MALTPPVAGLSGSYKHIQSSASNTWILNHNLGQAQVDVTVFNSAGDRVYVHPDYPGASANTIALNFPAPLSGTAYVRSL
jgi:hypothetical protein